MMKLKHQTGFTLVELLLYLATASILMLALTSFAILLSESRIKHRTISEVEQQGHFLMDQMTQAIRNSESVTGPTAGASSSSLTLDVIDSGADPTIFAVSSGTLQQQEASLTTNLSSSTVTVENLVFQNLSRENTPATVEVSFTVTSVNPSGRNEFDFTQDFKSSATVRYD